MSSSTIDDRPFDKGVSDALTDLALDLRWSFNHSADQLWEQLDPEHGRRQPSSSCISVFTVREQSI